MSAIDKEPFPRPALIAAAVLIGVSITAAAVGRQVQLNAPEVVAAAPAQTRDITFADREDGAVVVRDARDGSVIGIVERGEGGFIRGVMRGLARDRRMRDIGPEQAFRLSAWDTGQLVLEDLATGKRIDLNAFGADNRRAFAEILYAQDAV